MHPIRSTHPTLLRILSLLAALFFITSATHAQTTPKGATSMAFTVKSPDFANGADIPSQFTCSGEDRSPALDWSGAPSETKSFALIVDDPDAPVGTWVHWVAFNIPGSSRALPSAVEKKAQLADGTQQGMNDFPKVGYNGPCPPPGKPHRYFFKLYALNDRLTLGSGATKSALEKAMEGHILGKAEWMGRFRR
jgi:Raf kinase inhibitor-like YbhB/YbcL family protein